MANATASRGIKIEVNVLGNFAAKFTEIATGLDKLVAPLEQVSQFSKAASSNMVLLSDALTTFTKIPDISGFANGIKSLADMNVDGLKSAAGSLQKFANATKNIKFEGLTNLPDLSGFIKGVKDLNNIKTVKLGEAAISLSTFSDKLKELKLPANFKTFTEGLSHLSSIGTLPPLKGFAKALIDMKGITALPTRSIGALGNALQKFSGITIPTGAKLEGFIKALTKFNLKSVGKIDTKMLGELGKAFSEFKVTKFPDGEKLKSFIESLAALKNALAKGSGYASAMKKLKDTANAIDFSRVTSELRTLVAVLTAISGKATGFTEMKAKAKAAEEELKSTTATSKRTKEGLDAMSSSASKSGKGFNDVSEGAKKSSSNVKKVTKDLNVFQKVIKSLMSKANTYMEYRIVSDAIMGLKNAMTAGVSEIVNYDQALKDLQAITSATGNEVESMATKILDVASRTKFSTVEVAQGMRTLGQAGFDATSGIEAIEHVANLATGTLSSMGESVDLITTAIRVFGEENLSAAQASDVFANAVNKSKLTIDKMRTAVNYVGPVAKHAGMSFQEMSAAMAVLANSGLKASKIGTGLRRVIAELAAPNKKLTAAMHEAGLGVEDFSTSTHSFQEVLTNLRKVITDSSTAFDLFGKRGAAAVLTLTQDVSAFEDMLGTIGESGTAANMAATQMEGLGVSFKNLKDRMGVFAIALGEAGLTDIFRGLIGMAKGLVEVLTWLANNTFVQFVVKAGTALTALTALGAGINIIVSAFQAMASLQAISTLAKFAAKGDNLANNFALVAVKVGVFTSALKANAIAQAASTTATTTSGKALKWFSLYVNMARAAVIRLYMAIVANPWVALTTAILALGIAFVTFHKSLSDTIKENEKEIASLKSMQDELHKTKQSLAEVTQEDLNTIEGKKKHLNMIEALIAKYPLYAHEILKSTGDIKQLQEVLNNISADKAKKELDALQKSLGLLRRDLINKEAKAFRPFSTPDPDELRAYEEAAYKMAKAIVTLDEAGLEHKGIESLFNQYKEIIPDLEKYVAEIRGTLGKIQEDSWLVNLRAEAAVTFEDVTKYATESGRTISAEEEKQYKEHIKRVNDMLVKEKKLKEDRDKALKEVPTDGKSVEELQKQIDTKVAIYAEYYDAIDALKEKAKKLEKEKDDSTARLQAQVDVEKAYHERMAELRKKYLQDGREQEDLYSKYVVEAKKDRARALEKIKLNFIDPKRLRKDAEKAVKDLKNTLDFSNINIDAQMFGDGADTKELLKQKEKALTTYLQAAADKYKDVVDKMRVQGTPEDNADLIKAVQEQLNAEIAVGQNRVANAKSVADQLEAVRKATFDRTMKEAATAQSRYMLQIQLEEVKGVITHEQAEQAKTKATLDFYAKAIEANQTYLDTINKSVDPKNWEKQNKALLASKEKYYQQSLKALVKYEKDKVKATEKVGDLDKKREDEVTKHVAKVKELHTKAYNSRVKKYAKALDKLKDLDRDYADSVKEHESTLADIVDNAEQEKRAIRQKGMSASSKEHDDRLYAEREFAKGKALIAKGIKNDDVNEISRGEEKVKNATGILKPLEDEAMALYRVNQQTSALVKAEKGRQAIKKKEYEKARQQVIDRYKTELKGIAEVLKGALNKDKVRHDAAMVNLNKELAKWKEILAVSEKLSGQTQSSIEKSGQSPATTPTTPKANYKVDWSKNKSANGTFTFNSENTALINKNTDAIYANTKAKKDNTNATEEITTATKELGSTEVAPTVDTAPVEVLKKALDTVSSTVKKIVEEVIKPESDTTGVDKVVTSLDVAKQYMADMADNSTTAVMPELYSSEDFSQFYNDLKQVNDELKKANELKKETAATPVAPKVETSLFMQDMNELGAIYQSYIDDANKKDITPEVSEVALQNAETALSSMALKYQNLIDTFDGSPQGIQDLVDGFNALQEANLPTKELELFLGEIEKVGAGKEIVITTSMDDGDLEAHVVQATVDAQAAAKDAWDAAAEKNQLKLDIFENLDPADTQGLIDAAKYLEDISKEGKLSTARIYELATSISEVAKKNDEIEITPHIDPNSKEVEMEVKKSAETIADEANKALEDKQNAVLLKLGIDEESTVTEAQDAYDKVKNTLEKDDKKILIGMNLGIVMSPWQSIDSGITEAKDKLKDIATVEIKVPIDVDMKKVDELTAFLNKRYPDVEFKVIIDGAKEVKKLKDIFDDLLNKIVTITAKIKGAEAWTSALSTYNKLRNKTVTITTRYVEKREAGGLIGAEEYAGGGSVFRRRSAPYIGTGSGKKDDVPALLMKGEYIIKQSAVAKYGKKFMDMLNHGMLDMSAMVPKFAAGGFVLPQVPNMYKDGGIVSTASNTAFMAGRGLQLAMNPKAPMTHDGITYNVNAPSFHANLEAKSSNVRSKKGRSGIAGLLKSFSNIVPRMASGGSTSGMSTFMEEKRILMDMYDSDIEYAEQMGDDNEAMLLAQEKLEIEAIANELLFTLEEIRLEYAQEMIAAKEELEDSRTEIAFDKADAKDEYNTSMDDLRKERVDIETDFLSEKATLNRELKSLHDEYAKGAAVNARSRWITYTDGWFSERDQKIFDLENDLNRLESNYASDVEYNDKMKQSTATKYNSIMPMYNRKDKNAVDKNEREQELISNQAGFETYKAETNADFDKRKIQSETNFEIQANSRDTSHDVRKLELELQMALIDLRKKYEDSDSTSANIQQLGIKYWLNSGGPVGFPKGAKRKKDSVLAMLTPGEFVINEDAVNTYGYEYINALNNREVDPSYDDFPIMGASGKKRSAGRPTNSPATINGTTYHPNASSFHNKIAQRSMLMNSPLGKQSATSLTNAFSLAIPMLAEGGEIGNAEENLIYETDLLNSEYSELINYARAMGQNDLAYILQKEQDELNMLANELQFTLEEIAMERDFALQEAELELQEGLIDNEVDYREKLADIDMDRVNAKGDLDTTISNNPPPNNSSQSRSNPYTDSVIQEIYNWINSKETTGGWRKPYSGVMDFNNYGDWYDLERLITGPEGYDHGWKYRSEGDINKLMLELANWKIAYAEAESKGIQSTYEDPAISETIRQSAHNRYNMLMDLYNKQQVLAGNSFNANNVLDNNSYTYDVDKAQRTMTFESNRANVNYDSDVRETQREAAKEYYDREKEMEHDIRQYEADLAKELWELQKQYSTVTQAQGVKHWLNSGGPVNWMAGAKRGVDSVKAMLTPGEFVINESAVRKFGTGFFEKLNKMKLPYMGFNDGGLVSGSNNLSDSNLTSGSDTFLGTVNLAVGDKQFPVKADIGLAKSLLKEFKKMGMTLA